MHVISCAVKIKRPTKWLVLAVKVRWIPILREAKCLHDRVQRRVDGLKLRIKVDGRVCQVLQVLLTGNWLYECVRVGSSGEVRYRRMQIQRRQRGCGLPHICKDCVVQGKLLR